MKNLTPLLTLLGSLLMIYLVVEDKMKIAPESELVTLFFAFIALIASIYSISTSTSK